MIIEIKFLRPVRPKQMFWVLQYGDLTFWLYNLVIIISPSNIILFTVTVRAVLFVIFIIGLFNFLQVCKFIIDRTEPESNWNLTDLFSTLTVIYLRMTLCDLPSLFVCLTLFLIIFLFLHYEPFCPNLSQFWQVFCMIGAVLGPMYFSTMVASSGCLFFFSH